MCVKIPAVNALPIHRRSSVILYKRSIRETTLISDHAQYIASDIKLNSLSIFLFNLADKLTPVLNKNKKVSNPIMSLFERLIVSSQHIS